MNEVTIKSDKGAVLFFSLPEEQSAHLAAVHGLDWALVALDMDNYLRDSLKYDTLTDGTTQVLVFLRDKLHGAMEDHGVNLGMVE